MATTPSPLPPMGWHHSSVFLAIILHYFQLKSWLITVCGLCLTIVAIHFPSFQEGDPCLRTSLDNKFGSSLMKLLVMSNPVS